ncbi:Oidioi.mRNA.OKI2018_I69.XSR.g15271.t1.cds [Oikopleura dioica]|uniref:Oidioi.mRNA.OKI2018_I69.XSR.g15271.t1.cds n=1 Tax=Oikopleura dioica TaxID=34765 RepID=A0ABN7SJP5_OIKDI|nr:Oidioi.mRNA.OKI2018_I69.XSR.g15271.t1.cds [Oikopleura dioica]
MVNWDDIDDLSSVYINNVVYPDSNLNPEESASDDESLSEEFEMPKSVYVTSVPRKVFSTEETKAEFESLFTNATGFSYFPNFRRARVAFRDSREACKARVIFHLYRYMGEQFRVYLTNHTAKHDSREMDHLKPPKPTKVFLISPPPSPPEGWVQAVEDRPSSNQPGLALELIQRLASLKGGESHEIVESSDMHPSIVLSACADEQYEKFDKKPKFSIPQTRRPEMPR